MNERRASSSSNMEREREREKEQITNRTICFSQRNWILMIGSHILLFFCHILFFLSISLSRVSSLHSFIFVRFSSDELVDLLYPHCLSIDMSHLDIFKSIFTRTKSGTFFIWRTRIFYIEIDVSLCIYLVLFCHFIFCFYTIRCDFLIDRQREREKGRDGDPYRFVDILEAKEIFSSILVFSQSFPSPASFMSLHKDTTFTSKFTDKTMDLIKWSTDLFSRNFCRRSSLSHNWWYATKIFRTFRWNRRSSGRLKMKNVWKSYSFDFCSFSQVITDRQTGKSRGYGFVSSKFDGDEWQKRKINHFHREDWLKTRVYRYRDF